MQSLSNRREEIQKKLALLREQREREQRVFDELASENNSLSPDEIAQLASRLAEKDTNLTLNVVDDEDNIVKQYKIGDSVKVSGDITQIQRSERGLLIFDSLKRLYLNECGEILRILSSFEGKPAVELRFADGAEKMFFIDCLDLHGINKSIIMHNPSDNTNNTNINDQNFLDNKQKDKCMSNVKAINTRSKLRFTVAPLTSVNLTAAVNTNDFKSSAVNVAGGINAIGNDKLQEHVKEETCIDQSEEVSLVDPDHVNIHFNTSNSQQNVIMESRQNANTQNLVEENLCLNTKSESVLHDEPEQEQEEGKHLPESTNLLISTTREVHKSECTIEENEEHDNSHMYDCDFTKSESGKATTNKDYTSNEINFISINNINNKDDTKNINTQDVITAKYIPRESNNNINSINATNDKWENTNVHNSFGNANNDLPQVHNLNNATGYTRFGLVKEALTDKCSYSVNEELGKPFQSEYTDDIIAINAALDNVLATPRFDKLSEMSSTFVQDYLTHLKVNTYHSPRLYVKESKIPTTCSKYYTAKFPLEFHTNFDPSAHVNNEGETNATKINTDCKESCKVGNVNLTHIPRYCHNAPKNIPESTLPITHQVSLQEEEQEEKMDEDIEETDKKLINEIEIVESDRVINTSNDANPSSRNEHYNVKTTSVNESSNVNYNLENNPDTYKIDELSKMEESANAAPLTDSFTEATITQINPCANVDNNSDCQNNVKGEVQPQYTSPEQEQSKSYQEQYEQEEEESESTNKLDNAEETIITSFKPTSSTKVETTNKTVFTLSESTTTSFKPTSSTTTVETVTTKLTSASPELSVESSVNKSTESSSSHSKSRRKLHVMGVKQMAKPILIKLYENGVYDEDSDKGRPYHTLTVRPTYKTLSALKNLFERELGWRDGRHIDVLYDATGVEITDIHQLCDGQSVVASAGDRFIIPYPNTSLHHDAMKLSLLP